MNNYIVEYYSGGEWLRNGKYIFPLNMAQLLDERLDEAQITAYDCTVSSFAPNTLFRITLKENAETQTPTNTVFYFKSAGDVAVEMPNGSGRYKHTISLIEATKTFEGIVGQTLTFTNRIIQPYEPISAIYRIAAGTYTDDFAGFEIASLVSPKQTGTLIRLSTGDDGAEVIAVKEKLAEITGRYVQHDYGDPENYIKYYVGDDDTVHTITEGDYEDITLTSSVRITFNLVYSIGSPSSSQERRIVVIECYPIEAVPASGKTKKWTIKTVCQRLFQLAEPIFGNDYARFRLDTEQANELDKIIAPEFTMSQSTLREQLQVVGGYIHGEPRVIDVIPSPDNRHTYIVGFDYYGKHSPANIGANPYIRKQYETTLSNYCTRVHTDAVNLVNSLEWTRGTIVMPGTDQFVSLRTEQINVRADETNGVFKTQLPIYRPEKLLVGIATPAGNTLDPVDITQYLFEATEYDSLLSSYSGGYPHSKSYALRYAQGEKNITGMFFQSPNIISQALEKYSIVNILALASGETKSTIESKLQNNQASLVFQLTYTPVFSTAYTAEKSAYHNREPFTMVYNQSNGLIESDYYGENVKGVVERLGNVDEVRTYRFNSYSEIPKLGDCVGDFYISAINTEIDAQSIVCTIAFTKDFNRISHYIGINSEKRISEISTKQPYERNVVLTEYFSIETSAPQYSDPNLIGGNALTAFEQIFNGGSFKPITQAAFSRAETLNNGFAVEHLNPVILPVVACNQGNKVIMTASFKDNFSAGEKVQFVTQTNGVSGYWQLDARFCDFYGRAKYISFKMASKFSTGNSFPFDSPSVPAYPSSISPISTPKPYLCRKDSRERLSTFSYGIECISKKTSIIIGSGLAKLSKLCYNGNSNINLYLIPEGSEMPYKLDTDIIDYDRSSWVNAIDLSGSPVSATHNTNYFTLNGGEITAEENYIGYVVANSVTPHNETVIDEDGTAGTQTTYTGGEILFSEVRDIQSGETVNLFENLYFTIRR